MTAPEQPAVSTDGQTLYDALGPLTGQDAELGWPLLRFCDAATLALQQVDDLARDTEDGPGWSQVLDPDRAPAAGLPWLAQFVGGRIDTALPEAEQRAQVRARLGFDRGTVKAILAAAAPFLTATQAVRVVERINGDPYRFAVVVFGWEVAAKSYATLSGELPTYADLSAEFNAYVAAPHSTEELRRAVTHVKPAGLQFRIVEAPGAFYMDLTLTYPTYADLSARWATYEPMTSAPPGA